MGLDHSRRALLCLRHLVHCRSLLSQEEDRAVNRHPADLQHFRPGEPHRNRPTHFQLLLDHPVPILVACGCYLPVHFRHLSGQRALAALRQLLTQQNDQISGLRAPVWPVLDSGLPVSHSGLHPWCGHCDLVLPECQPIEDPPPSLHWHHLVVQVPLWDCRTWLTVAVNCVGLPVGL